MGLRNFNIFLFGVDDAFPLSQNIMKPYLWRNLNDKKQYLATDYHTFTGSVKTHLEFCLVDFRLSNLTSKFAVDAILADVIPQNLWCKSCESYTTPGFVDELDESQVIHEGYWRQNNVHTSIAITHIQTEQQLSKNSEAVSSVLDDYLSSKAMAYTSLRFGVTKMYICYQ